MTGCPSPEHVPLSLVQKQGDQVSMLSRRGDGESQGKVLLNEKAVPSGNITLGTQDA